MKTEDFDKALRDKLNSINPAYSNSEIEKVFRHVKKNRRWAWKGLKGSWVFYSLSAAAMVLVTTVVLYKIPSGSLGEKYEVTGPKSKVGVVQDNKLIADSMAEKNISDIQSAQISSGINQAEQTAALATGRSKSADQVAATANQNTNREKELFSPGSENSENKTEQADLKTVNYITPGSNVLSKQKSDSNKKDVPVEAPRNGNNIIQAAVIQEVRPSQPAVQQADMSTPVVALITTVAQPSDSAQVQPGNVLKPDSSNVDSKKIRVLPGISFNVTNQRIGTGLSMDVIFGKYFGITTGLTYNFLNEQQFPDRETMHGGPPHGFNPHINDHFGDKNHVSDIRIQNQLLQLPVAINYRVPFKHNFVLNFSMGTELDLYLYQQVSYTRHLDSTRTDYPHFGSRGNVVPFNSMFFGAGISKQWNHLLLNVQPSYSQPVKDLFYKPSEPEFGIGIRLMYSFGK